MRKLKKTNKNFSTAHNLMTRGQYVKTAVIMEDQLVNFSRILIFLTVYSIAVEGYKLKCPVESQWMKRAKARCYLKKQYHCFLDKSENMSMEICLEPDYLPEGFKSIYSGNRDAKVCSSKRFSPFISMTSDRNECVYQKSLCSEEGQLLFDNGTKLQDVSCGCDYKRGYRFLLKPKHACFCYPRTEDCSCYKTACESGEVLSKDYVCVQTNSKNTLSTCPDIMNTRIKNENKHQVKTITTYPIRQNVSATVPAILLTFLIPTLIIVAFLFKKKIITPEAVLDLSFIPELEQMLEKQSFFILKGRDGTGKTTALKCILRKYRKIGYNIIPLETIKNTTPDDFCKDLPRNCLIYFEDIPDSTQCVETFKTAFKQVHLQDNTDSKTLVVATMKRLPRKFDVTQTISNCLVKEFNESDIVFDLDKKQSFTTSDKEKILRFHMTKTKIIPQRVDKKLQKRLLNEENYIGFPEMCAKFSRHRDHIKLGLDYFKQPPQSLINLIDKLKDDGYKDSGKAYAYCLLVNVLLYGIDKSKHEEANYRIKLSMNEVYKTNWQSIDINKTFPNSSFQNKIEELGPDLIIVDDRARVTFSCKTVRHAVMISYSKVCSFDVLEKCDIFDVLTYLRPFKYKSLNGEVVLKLHVSEYQEFAKRLARNFRDTIGGERSTSTIIGYLEKFTNTAKGVEFLILIVEELKCSTPVYSKAFSPFFRAFGDCIRKYAPTFRKDDILTFSLAREWLSAKGEQNYPDIIKAILCYEDKVCDVLVSPVDSYKNCLLHYFMIWNGETENKIIFELLSKLDKDPDGGMMKALKTQNSDGHSPIHFAAFCGRYEFLSELKTILQSKTKKQQSPLSELVNILHETCVEGKDQTNDKTYSPLERLKHHFEADLYYLQPDIRFGDKADFENIKTLFECSNME